MTVPLIVTTAARPSFEIEKLALLLSEELTSPYLSRLGRSVQEIYTASNSMRLLIVGADHLRLHDQKTGAEYYYHPNMFLTRGSVVVSGGSDPFLRAVNLQPGDQLLDCTLGFGSEAALASLFLGDSGRVVGLESVQVLAAVTRHGLKSFPLRSAPLAAALRRIEVVTADHCDYLSECTSGEFDVIYFDPFFSERLSGSEASVNPLFIFGNPAPLSLEAVSEARRVARRRVVIKHPSHFTFPHPLSEWVTHTIGSRHSRLVYRVMERGQEGCFKQP